MGKLIENRLIKVVFLEAKPVAPNAEVLGHAQNLLGVGLSRRENVGRQDRNLQSPRLERSGKLGKFLARPIRHDVAVLGTHVCFDAVKPGRGNRVGQFVVGKAP